MNITKEATKVLKLIYKKYEKNLKKGLSRRDANKFNTDNIHDDFPKENSDDFYDVLYELKENDLIDIDIIGNYSLTSDAISYMQRNFARHFDEVTDKVSKFIP